MDGCITPRGVRELADKVKKDLNLDQANHGPAQFGRPVREKYFQFEEGWQNLNHGKLGRYFVH